MHDGRMGEQRRARISSTDAAFQGLSLVRREPAAFAVWVLLSALFSGVVGVLQTLMFTPAMNRFEALSAQAKAAGVGVEPSALIAALGDVWRFNALPVVLSLIFYAVMNAAVFRAVLKPKARGLGYLRLGADELRQAGLFIYIFLCIIAAEIVLAIAAVIVAVVAALVFAGGAQLSPDASRGLGVAAVIGVFLFAAAMLMVLVRFSLAGPLTFDSKRIQLFSSWRLTRGRFWVLFGAYVLAAFVFLVLGIVCLLITGAAALMIGSGLGGIESLVRPNAQSIADYFTPVRIIFLVLNAPLAAAWLATQAGVPAEVYAAIREEQERRRAPVDLSHSFGSPALTKPAAPDGDFPIVPPAP